jgi:nucleoside-diphosphate-sugar epimerase
LILVAGATGNLGRALIDLIGHRNVIAAARSPENLPPNCQIAYLGHKGVAADIPWSKITAVINAAGAVAGTEGNLRSVNVELPAALAAQAKAHAVKCFVQVSSFAVNGNASIINSMTPLKPIGIYGITKIEAEERLAELASDNFRVVNVRLPFMFSSEHPKLIMTMVRFASFARVIPVGRDGSPRSMMTFEDAAKVLVHSATADWRGSVYAASESTFSPRFLSDIILEEKNRKVGVWALPKLAARAICRVAPTIYRRLLQASVLDPDINRSREVKGLSGIESTIREIVKTA